MTIRLHPINKIPTLSKWVGCTILICTLALLQACGGSASGGGSSTSGNGSGSSSSSSAPTSKSSQAASTVVTYTNVPGLAPSGYYKFRVRTNTADSAWVDSFAFVTTAKDKNNNDLNDTTYFDNLSGWTNTYTNFVMTEPVEVEISRVDGSPISSAAVHPKVRAQAAIVRNGKAYVVMNNPAQITVDIDGKMDAQNTGYGYKGPPIHTVTVFANPPLANVPKLGDAGVYAVEPGTPPPTVSSGYTTLYFKPGVHDIGRAFPIWADKSYYIPGDAIVYGSLNSSSGGAGNGRGIRIFGYGTLSGARLVHPSLETRPTPVGVQSGTASNPIYMLGASNATLEGITIADSAHHSVQMWASYDPAKPTIARWVKIFTWRVNGDGINPGANMVIEDSFLRTQDDALYANGRGMKRLVVWNDANGAAFTVWSLPSRPLVIEDSDVVYARAKWHKWSGGRVFSLRAEGGAGAIAGGQAVFKNIRLEDRFPTYQAFFLATSGDFPDSFVSPTQVGSGMNGVTFQNISTAAKSIYGYPETLHGNSAAPISNITFDNVVIAGEPVKSLSDFSNVNQYVTNVTIK